MKDTLKDFLWGDMLWNYLLAASLLKRLLELNKPQVSVAELQKDKVRTEKSGAWSNFNQWEDGREE